MAKSCSRGEHGVTGGNYNGPIAGLSLVYILRRTEIPFWGWRKNILMSLISIT